MSVQRIATFAFAMLAVSLWIAAANATLIDVNMYDYNNDGIAGVRPTMTGAAAIGTASDGWNLYGQAYPANGDGYLPMALKATNGDSTGVTFNPDFGAYGYLAAYGGPFQEAASPLAPLFYGGLATGYSGADPAQFHLSGLGSSKAGYSYDLYLYSDTNFSNATAGYDIQSQVADLTVNGVPVTIGPNSDVQHPAGYSTLMPGNNFIELHPTVDDDGLLTIHLVGGPSADGAAILNGFQLQITAPTPEPGTLILLGMGLVGLLCYAWRKRK